MFADYIRLYLKINITMINIYQYFNLFYLLNVYSILIKEKNKFKFCFLFFFKNVEIYFYLNLNFFQESFTFLKEEKIKIKHLVKHCNFSLFLGFDSSPEVIVFSWNSAGSFCYELFKSSPEINFLKNWIHPSINDTIPSIKLTCMMSMMFLMIKDKSGGLKESNNWMWLNMYHMCPFMDLIGKNSQNNTKDNCPTIT